jgi:hypothetical protein
MVTTKLGITDALGNPIYQFDVVHYGGRAGSHGYQSIAVVLGVTPNGNISVVKMGQRWDWDDESRTGQYVPALRKSTLTESKNGLVLVHPYYWNDAVRKLVTEAQRAYG